MYPKKRKLLNFKELVPLISLRILSLTFFPATTSLFLSIFACWSTLSIWNLWLKFGFGFDTVLNKLFCWPSLRSGIHAPEPLGSRKFWNLRTALHYGRKIFRNSDHTAPVLLENEFRTNSCRPVRESLVSEIANKIFETCLWQWAKPTNYWLLRRHLCTLSLKLVFFVQIKIDICYLSRIVIHFVTLISSPSLYFQLDLGFRKFFVQKLVTN